MNRESAASQRGWGQQMCRSILGWILWTVITDFFIAAQDLEDTLSSSPYDERMNTTGRYSIEKKLSLLCWHLLLFVHFILKPFICNREFPKFCVQVRQSHCIDVWSYTKESLMVNVSDSDMDGVVHPREVISVVGYVLWLSHLILIPAWK